jgi:centrosomal protein CEP76
LNLFLGKVRVPLHMLASGSMARSENIKKATGEKRQFARVYYKMLFQEVWDYKLTFEAWKGSNIIGEMGAVMDPKIEITLMNDEDLPSVHSHVIK